MCESKILFNFRKHQQFFINSDVPLRVEKEILYNTRDIAVIVIGMWSNHQCKIADAKLQELAPKINVFLKKCRQNGMHIVFGSSSLTKLPKYRPNVKNMKNIPFHALKDCGLSFPQLPFNVGEDGGVVEKNTGFDRAAVDIHPAIEVESTDGMSDNVKEILNYFYHHGKKLCLVVGVHTNMCILDRPYGMKAMARFGFPMAIVRDLTDPMVVPDGIHVKTREDGLNQLIQYIETYFAPSVDSRDIAFVESNKKIIRIDIDDTICKDDPSYSGEDMHIYKRKAPIKDRITTLNTLYDSGNTIIYWTSRGIESGKDWLDFTRSQLESWGVKYSSIICGKSKFDIFVDDKVENSEKYF